MFIKDCTILYTATVRAATACRNRQTCFAAQSRVPISRKFIQKYTFNVRYAAVLGLRGSASRAGTSAAAAAAQNPCNFKSKCPSLHEHSLSHHNALRHLVSD